MSQQSVRQAERRAVLDVQAVRRRESMERLCRLERSAVDVLAMTEFDSAVRDVERRGEASATGDDRW
jgi:hypothetical protein